MSSTGLDEPSIKIYHDLFLDSNHKLSSLSFQVATSVPRLTWRLGILEGSDKADVHFDRFLELSSLLLHYDSTHSSQTNLQNTSATIEKFNTKLCQIIYTSLLILSLCLFFKKNKINNNHHDIRTL